MHIRERELRRIVEIGNGVQAGDLHLAAVNVADNGCGSVDGIQLTEIAHGCIIGKKVGSGCTACPIERVGIVIPCHGLKSVHNDARKAAYFAHALGFFDCIKIAVVTDTVKLSVGGAGESKHCIGADETDLGKRTVRKIYRAEKIAADSIHCVG